jgi:hypothetical protein
MILKQNQSSETQYGGHMQKPKNGHVHYVQDAHIMYFDANCQFIDVPNIKTQNGPNVAVTKRNVTGRRTMPSCNQSKRRTYEVLTKLTKLEGI